MTDFVQAVKKLQDEMKATRSAAQLKHSSIENGAIVEKNADGTLVGQYGKQFDGTSAPVQFNGPPPPTPSTPTMIAGAGQLSEAWDGLFLNANGVPDETVIAPSNYSRVEYHVYATAGAPLTAETLMGTSETSRGLPVVVGPLGAAGTYYGRLVAVSLSGVYGTPSTEASVEVVVGDVAGELASIASQAENAMNTAAAAQTTADGKNTIYNSPTAPVAPTGGFKVNDIWRQWSGTLLQTESFWNGTTWIAQPLDHTAIASVDAGTISVGFLSGDRIAANTIVTGMIAVNTSAQIVTGYVPSKATADPISAVMAQRIAGSYNAPGGAVPVYAATPTPSAGAVALTLKPPTTTTLSAGSVFRLQGTGSVSGSIAAVDQWTLPIEKKVVRLTGKVYGNGFFQVAPVIELYASSVIGSSSAGNQVIGTVATAVPDATLASLGYTHAATYDWSLDMTGGAYGTSTVAFSTELMYARSATGTQATALFPATVQGYIQTPTVFIADGAITAAKVNVASLWADSAFINSAVINVLTTTNLTGKTIQTAATGARVVVNSTGLKQYDAANNVIVDMTDGSLNALGVFKSGETGSLNFVQLSESVDGDGNAYGALLFSDQDPDDGTIRTVTLGLNHANGDDATLDMIGPHPNAGLASSADGSFAIRAGGGSTLTLASTAGDVVLTTIKGDVSVADDLDDTGWITIPLASGWVLQTTNQPPQVRRRHGVIYMRNPFKKTTGNLPTTDTLFATLPTGFRPEATTDSGWLYNKVVVSDTPSQGILVVKNDGSMTIKCSAATSTWAFCGPAPFLAA